MVCLFTTAEREAAAGLVVNLKPWVLDVTLKELDSAYLLTYYS